MPPKRSRCSEGAETPPVVSRRKSSRPSPCPVSAENAPPPPPASRRKQSRPHRVSADAEIPFGAEVLLKVADTPSPPPASPQAQPNSTTSLMAALRGRRQTKSQPPPRVECGVCHESICASTFDRHAMSAHNGLARPAEQSQDFNKAEKLAAFRRVLKAGMPLTCPLCQKTLTTNTGFYHHHNQCGQDVQPVKCPKCDLTFRPLSLAAHMRKHERLESGGDADAVQTPAKPRRQRKRLALSAADADVSDDESEDPSFDLGTPNGTPRRRACRGRALPAEAARWREQIAAEGQAICQQTPCTFTGSSMDDMHGHVPSCPGRPGRNKSFQCDYCKKRAETSEEMLRHVVSFHPFATAARRCSASGGSRGVRSRTGAGAGTVTSDMASELTYFTSVERQGDPRAIAAKYWAAQPKSAALSRVVATECRLATAEEVALYSPPMKLSPAYKVQTIGAPDDLRTYDRMDTFAAEELENGVLAFCGGPIVSCDWCPQRAGGSQLLAVSCLPTVDTPLPPTQPQTVPTAVQLWSFTEHVSSATLEYCLCVDGGPVLDLAWCPATTGPVARDRRLGALATAGADGRVRVMLMPTPDSLPATGHGQAFYRKRPELRLQMYGDLGRSPCARLDWANTDGNRTLAAVFGNGTVAVWEVTTTSPLLSERDGSTRVLYPLQVLAAHRGHGTALALCPASDRFLVSAGRDRMVHVWDREEPALVQRAANKLRPVLSDVCWPPATKKLVNAYDHSLFVGSPTVMMSDISLPVQDVPFFTHGAKATSVSVSCPVNGVAVASESGLVALAQWRAMLSHKQRAELRRLLLKVVVERLTARAAEDGEQTLGDQFTHCWETCGVTVWDAKLHEKGVIQEGFDEHTSTLGNWVSNYPFMAVNKVCWNHNADADSWLAIGMECGFLRVLAVPPGAFTAVRP